MYSSIKSVTFTGIQIDEIEVQTHISIGGLPTFAIVGLGSKAVSEAKDRIRAAFHSLGLGFPARKITVNLAPSHLYKSGSHLDLPIAIGILIAMSIIPQDELLPYFALGELSLNGTLQETNGVLVAGLHASSKNMGVICPASNANEAILSGNSDILPANTLLSIINHFKNETHIAVPKLQISEKKELSKIEKRPDFTEVKGQARVKRALEIAAAGEHHILIAGYPGSGKSMLIKRFEYILPDLSAKERLEIIAINSLIGGNVDPITIKRAFRNPHSSASLASIIGGGQNAYPGEVTLAHNGALFLDEIAEFLPNVLDALRQPLESRIAVIARAHHHVTYPARFQLIGTMNPCKCGYFRHKEEKEFCKKAPICAIDYQRRLSGPLMDRFDIKVSTDSIPDFPIKLPDDKSIDLDLSSTSVASRIAKARARQVARYEELELNSVFLNVDLEGHNLAKYANLNPATSVIVDGMIRNSSSALSMRGYDKVLKIARTIADLADRDQIILEDIMEALEYRKIDLLVGSNV